MLPTAVQTSPSGRILVADDDPNLRDLLRALLEAEGFTCVTVDCVQAAQETFDGDTWDLVLADMCLGLNRRGGFEIIEYITRLDNTTPVIMITGQPSIQHAVEAVRRGAMDFIAKPFDREIFLHQVHKALQERRLRTENRRLQAQVNKAAVIEKLNRELDQRINELYRLYTISDGLNEFMESGPMFERIAQLAAEVTMAQRCAVLVFDRSRRYLRLKASVGIPLPALADIRLKLRGGDTEIRLPGVPSQPITPADLPSPEVLHAAGLPSGVVQPLLVGGEVFGLIALAEKLGGGDFTREDLQILSALVEKAGIRLENQALYEGIYANLVDTLTSLVSTLEAKDPYTRQHSQRVTEYGMALARIMHLGDDAIEMIHFAGMLHDIGKIGVHDAILTKTGRLTDEEYERIKEHPIIGERIVAPLGLVDQERAIIRHHHERFDGRGYPDHLRGEEIPLLARIVAVADAFDAMTTNRSYRLAMPVENALAEMQRCAGSQFDPTIVKLWVEAVERGQIPLHIPETFTSAVSADAS